jgi:hypothetical protein
VRVLKKSPSHHGVANRNPYIFCTQPVNLFLPYSFPISHSPLQASFLSLLRSPDMYRHRRRHYVGFDFRCIRPVTNAGGMYNIPNNTYFPDSSPFDLPEQLAIRSVHWCVLQASHRTPVSKRISHSQARLIRLFSISHLLPLNPPHAHL